MTPEQQQPITEQAARWISALESGGAQEQVAFAAWLRASPQHMREFLVLTALDKEINEIDVNDLDVEKLIARSSSNVVLLSHPTNAAFERLAAARTHRSARWWWAAGLAAGVAILALVGVPRILDLNGSLEYATVVGEQRAFELADGSVIRLNPLSRVRVNYSDDARDIRLLEGEANFKVARDAARPFRVSSGRAVIQAIGTQFHVYRRSSGTVVSVIEGVVEISSARQWPALSGSPTNASGSVKPADSGFEPLQRPARLVAGEEARIAADGNAIRRRAIDPAQRAAWRERHVIFSGDTLADIAEDFNRYNRAPRIRVEGEALQAKRYSGAFDADDPESLVEYLQGDSGIAVEHAGDEIVIRAR